MSKSAKKSLTPYEISIIKRILKNGCSNQEALTWINKKRTTEMSVNPARIVEVKKEIVGADIDPATNKELEAFKNSDISSPMDRKTIKQLFSFTQEKINSIESDFIEYKENFSIPEMQDCYSTIAGFANNKGGYLVFGVKDNDLTLNALTDEKIKKLEKYINHDIDFQKVFNQNISIEFKKFKPKRKNGFLGIIYIYPSSTKPVISVRDWKNIKEGTIYYRYFAKTEKIHAGELEKIISDRIATKSQEIISKTMIEEFQKSINEIMQRGSQ